MYFVSLRLNVSHLDDLEELLFEFSSKHAAGYLPEELLQHAGYGIDAEVVHVDEPSRLQEVRQFFHGALVARRSKHIFSVRSLLVQFQY